MAVSTRVFQILQLVMVVLGLVCFVIAVITMLSRPSADDMFNNLIRGSGGRASGFDPFSAADPSTWAVIGVGLQLGALAIRPLQPALAPVAPQPYVGAPVSTPAQQHGVMVHALPPEPQDPQQPIWEPQQQPQQGHLTYPDGTPYPAEGQAAYPQYPDQQQRPPQG